MEALSSHSENASEKTPPLDAEEVDERSEESEGGHNCEATAGHQGLSLSGRNVTDR